MGAQKVLGLVVVPPRDGVYWWNDEGLGAKAGELLDGVPVVDIVAQATAPAPTMAALATAHNGLPIVDIVAPAPAPTPAMTTMAAMPKMLELSKNDVEKIHKAGHPPFQRMWDFIRGGLSEEVRKQWPEELARLKDIVAKVVDDCESCTRRQVNGYMKPGTKLPSTVKFNEQLSIDLVKLETQGGEWVLVMKDRATKMVMYTLVENKSSETVAKKCPPTRHTRVYQKKSLNRLTP